MDEVIVHLTIDGELIETTFEHPFHTADGRWVHAGGLAVGTRIRRLDGGSGSVEAVAIVSAAQPMFNLTVAEARTFFVGDGAWLVHNTNPNCFEVIFQADLKKGIDYPKQVVTKSEKVKLRQAHNRAANRQLYEATQTDPTFGTWLNINYPDIYNFVQPSKKGNFKRKSPTDWEWHHVPDQEGVLWLMRASDHGNFSGKIHWQPDNRGGMAIWGILSKNERQNNR